ncbi:MAG: hypothetical protein LBU04_08125, partial [Christensenellaceae bacterium]|nr:hypothetical protein [Christensenellaceae bacterium]
MKYILSTGNTKSATIGDAIYIFLDNNRNKLSENNLDTVFDILKKYYIMNDKFHNDIPFAAKLIYRLSKNPVLRGDIIYFIEQVINDSTNLEEARRGNNYISGVDLNIFDKKMKDEVVKNLNNPYKNDIKRMLSENMILLGGALNMTELEGRLQIIADSAVEFGYKNAACVALCRMGNKKMLKKYFADLNSMKLRDALSKYDEIEYIKQKESIDLLLRILYSDETRPQSKETLPPKKIAYYAIDALERISKNFPYAIQQEYGKNRKDKEVYLEKMREWA